jgi:hypothetical protein
MSDISRPNANSFSAPAVIDVNQRPAPQAVENVLRIAPSAAGSQTPVHQPTYGEMMDAFPKELAYVLTASLV